MLSNAGSIIRTGIASIQKSTYKSISYFVTTPIFYVNSSPHIGHVHTLLLADALNIYHRLKLDTKQTIFSTGTDEHGIKIQTAAESSNVACQDFCDLNSSKFRNLFNQYNTTITDFIRTSEDRHIGAVRSVWRELHDKGFIYKDVYSGWYCSSEETFVPESQVIKKEHEGQVEHLDQNENKLIWSSEENYMFRLSDVGTRVHDWLSVHKPLVPDKFNDEAIKMLDRSGMADISISRPKERLKWGIEVPGDPSQTIYVWLDALTNYLTIAGYPCDAVELKRWPIDCQVIGKDIIKFHAIYWPAFLIALSLPLPRKLICHSHWLLDSLKMSKSRGNVVDPLNENQILSAEGLRYYLLRSSTPKHDTDYSRTQAVRKINAELADTYGNLLSRSCAPAINPKRIIPTKLLDVTDPKIIEIKERLGDIASICERHYECADFYKAIDEIMSILRLNNSLYQSTEPWKLVKKIDSSEQSFKDYFNLQAITFESLRICSILLQPIIPNLTKLSLDRMNVSDRSWHHARLSIDNGDPSTSQRHINDAVVSVLFRKIKSSDI